MTYLKELTQEDRELIAASIRAKKQYAKENFNLNSADFPHWRELASKYNVRLPVFYQPATSTKYIMRVCKATGTDYKDFLESTGFTTLKQLALANPTWNAASMVGLCLEYIDESQLDVDKHV